MAELREALVRAGFRTGPDPIGNSNWLAYRQTDDTVRRCECNSDKPGVQVVVRLFETTLTGKTWRSAEIDITGEAGGRWYRLTCYGIDEDQLLADLPAIEGALVRAWQALSPTSPPPTPQEVPDGGR